MSNADLRFLVEKVRAACADRQIPLLCEVYDGQWQHFITTSKEGNHLTKLHARNTWNWLAGFTKDRVLEDMYNASAVRTWDLDLLAVHKRINANGILELSNISVWKNESRSLFAESHVEVVISTSL